MNTSVSPKPSARRAKAQKAISDALALVIECFTSHEDIVAQESYERGFDDGVEQVKEDFRRVSDRASDEEVVPARPYVPTEIDKIVQDGIVSSLSETPGLRTSDIASKMSAFPIKGGLSEKSIRLAVDRLKNTGKIEDKAGRWYLAGSKPPAQDFRVMRYLEDGSKYLGADILK